jgi:peptidoglycan/xylan/chitin deacetylase (PgdA/CDA1 family)/glycosyltransferase involved in cell wall biosynthesis
MTDTAVVIPCYQAGRTLGEALASVAAQSRPVAECVIVDDGSDEPFTRRVLEELRHEGVAVVRAAHRGVAAARNRGVEMTSSPYVVLLDADDVLAPRYVERLAGILDERPEVDFATCRIQAFGEADYAWTPPPCDWVNCFVRGGPHVSSMFRRRVWNAVPGFDDALEGYEDQDWWLSVIEHGFRGIVVDEPLLHHRVRTGSRYDLAILADRFRRTTAAIRVKHPGTSFETRARLVVEKELFRQELRCHGEGISKRLRQAQEEVGALGESLERLRSEVSARGLAPFDWGETGRGSLPSGPSTSIEDHYARRFLRANRADIAGRVLLVGERPRDPSVFAAGAEVSETPSLADDSTQRGAIPHLSPGAFDCIVMMTALNEEADFRAVITAAHRLLKPGGVLLCAAAALGAIRDGEGAAPPSCGRRFTAAALRRALAERWPAESVEVTPYGNLQACAAALLGLPWEAVAEEVLAVSDEGFPLLSCARAVKPATGSASAGGCDAAAVILLYHRIGEHRPDAHALQVTRERFLVHMRHLRDACSPVTLDALAAGLAQGRLPDRGVAVTFDDGYLHHLEEVAPMLAELGIPATFFVTTEGLERRYENWWDVCERILLGEHPLPPALDLYGDGSLACRTATSDDRVAAHRRLIEHLYLLSAPRRGEALAALSRWCGVAVAPRDSHRVLLRHEIARLAAAPGAAVGAHSVHHVVLPSQSEQDQWNEVGRSKEALESSLGRPVRGFSYPYGECGRIAFDAARSAGFEYAVTVEPRPVRPGAHRLLLPRFEVKGDAVTRFETWLSQAFAGGA